MESAISEKEQAKYSDRKTSTKVHWALSKKFNESAALVGKIRKKRTSKEKKIKYINVRKQKLTIITNSRTLKPEEAERMLLIAKKA